MGTMLETEQSQSVISKPSLRARDWSGEKPLLESEQPLRPAISESAVLQHPQTGELTLLLDNSCSAATIAFVMPSLIRKPVMPKTPNPFGETEALRQSFDSSRRAIRGDIYQLQNSLKRLSRIAGLARLSAQIKSSQARK